MSRLIATIRSRPRTAFFITLVAVATGAALAWRGGPAVGATTAVRRGTLTPTLTLAGALRPAQAITYHSPLVGREAEVTFLAAEGLRVNEGDLILKFDATPLDRDLERAEQDLRQAQVELQVADIDRADAEAASESLTTGDAALSVDEMKTRVQLAEKRVARLRAEHESIEPLLARGYVTREEVKRTSDELDQAEEDLAIARRRADVLIARTTTRDRQKAELQLRQKDTQRDNARARLREAQARVAMLQAQKENASVYARRPGVVVYEEYLNASPRRKIRPGDRVTDTPGVVTVADLDRMLVDASVTEADIHRVAPGQMATVVLEAFRDRSFTGKVTRVGTVARSSSDGSLEEKRFDLVVELDSPDPLLKPEMTARVDVRLGERRNVLLVPLSAVADERGRPVVYVPRRGGMESRAVRLGESTTTEVEVMDGLAEGELVVLTDPGSIVAPSAPAPAGGTASAPGATAAGRR